VRRTTNTLFSIDFNQVIDISTTMQKAAEPGSLPDLDAVRLAAAECLRASQWEEALHYFDIALRCAARAEDENGRARALEGLGRHEEALLGIERALAINPANVADLRNRGILLVRLGRKTEGLASYEAALAIQPDHTDILIKRALLLNELDRREDALESVDRALRFSPDDLVALNARLIVLDNLGRYEVALQCADRMLALAPNGTDAINNTGMVLARMGRFRESLRCYDRSLDLDPQQPQAQYNRCLIRLSLGDWIRGFQEFECRWNTSPLKYGRDDTLGPLWLGQQELRSKTLFLYHEQGYGDTLQCLRFIPKLARRGARLILAVPPSLRTLAQGLCGVSEVISSGEPVPAHDLQCPLMSLLLAFRTTPDTIPCEVPYLQADSESIERWGRLLGGRGKWRIGLVWSGRRYAPPNYPRDLPLSSLEPLLALDAQFFCLQTEMSDADRLTMEKYPERFCPHGPLKDFGDTAALIENLDLVISVDTAVAHLTGALGKPVWLLNRYAACWRWQPPSAPSCWYPTLREFRQKAVGDWSGPISEISAALAKLLQGASDALPKPRPVAVAHQHPREAIRLVCATRLTKAEFIAISPLGRSLPAFQAFPENQCIELRLFPENRTALSTVYNMAIEESRTHRAILLFVHDDVYLSDYFWADHLQTALSHFDMVGLVGNRRRVSGQASWMYLDRHFTRDNDDHLSGVIGHGDPFPNLRQLSVYGPPGQEVKLLDGVFLAARSEILIERDLRFDPRFAFHFYDMDFCRQAELRGMRMGTWPMSLVHASAGQLGGEVWREAYEAYLTKYGEG
jgi:tetratricopeptide (TPR) repeat protein